MKNSRNAIIVDLLSGGVAGTTVDVVLFPLDTLKTRLQSERGLLKTGGFRGLYSGIGPVILGSAPSAALFFVTYEYAKKVGKDFSPHRTHSLHMMAASTGEILACLVRVPVEVLKQRSQASLSETSWSILRKTMKEEGFVGFYRGYWSTILREVPFSFIQFPVWEFLKSNWRQRRQKNVEPWQSALCGAVAGGFAAVLTTPLDVAKTRIMLSKKGSMEAKGFVLHVLTEIWKEKGFKGLFAGVLPRVVWISLGGAIFLGSYEQMKCFLKFLNHPIT